MSENANEYDDLLDDAEHPWRNRLIGMAALAVLVAAGVYALWAMVLSDGGSSGEETQTATVQRGFITNTLSTSGVVVAQSTAELSFGQSGLVTAVNVTLGQEVKQGDVLAEIESDEDLESALVSAEVSLTSAQAGLDELLEGSSESDLASADQSLLQAQASYDQAESALEDLLDGPSESELLSAELAVASAESELANAEESRTNLYSASDDAIAAAEEAVSEAEDALANAKDAAASATDSLTLAKASLYGAETAYCEDGSYGVSFCNNPAAPISSADEDALLEVVATGEPDRAAQASQVLSANISYKNARASKLSANYAVESAEADLEAAKDDLEEAETGPSSAEIASEDVAVAEAQLSLDEAKEELADLLAGPTQEDLEEAQSNLDQAAAALAVAQANWNDVHDGPDPLDIELQQEEVRQAELSVEQAREDLEDAQIIALFDGTVAALAIEVGQMVAAQETAVILNTPDALRLDLLISESDLPEVEVGQSGFASFDALEGGMFPFVIDSIGTNPTSTQGVVTYEVRTTLQTERSPDAAGALPAGAAGDKASLPAGDKASQRAGTPDKGAIPFEGARQPAGIAGTDAKPLPGMNASVTITVDQAKDVLIVPTQAIQAEGFESIVEVLKDDGSTEKVAVQTGISDGMNTEITEGLEEGQTIIVPARAATSVQPAADTGFPQRGFEPGEGKK
jgi:multidrug efflux pump subunit AcrA (membrane-fusion protein)